MWASMIPSTMEDATSAIYSMFLVDEEGTASSLRDAAWRA